jgi:hypothetical protein
MDSREGELPESDDLLKKLGITDSHYYKINSVLLRKSYQTLVPEEGAALLKYLKLKNLFHLLRHEILAQDKKLAARMTDEERRSGVLYGAGAVQHDVAEHDARGGRSGQKESAEQFAGSIEGLHGLLRSRHIGDDEPSIRGDVKAGRLNHATVFLPDLENLARHRFAGIHRVHRMAAPVEDEVGTARVLLEVDRLFVAADYVRRKAAGGAKHLDAQCRVGA